MSAALSALLARDPANSSTSLREERKEMAEEEHGHSTVSAALHKVMHNKVVKWSGLAVLVGAFAIGVWCLVTGHIPYFRKAEDDKCCPKPRCCKKPVAGDAAPASVDPCAAPKPAVSDDCCAAPVDPCAAAGAAAPAASDGGEAAAPAAAADAPAADAPAADATPAADGAAAERRRRRRRGEDNNEEEQRLRGEDNDEEEQRRSARKAKKGESDGKNKNFFERLRALKH
jgi:type IV secretory pathway VirB10-like protein